jgi:hypothetical protein
MKDILKQPKFKGDVHQDKPFSDFKARSAPSSGFAGLIGGPGSAVAAPGFRKSKANTTVSYARTQHGHGSVKNKFRIKV